MITNGRISSQNNATAERKLLSPKQASVRIGKSADWLWKSRRGRVEGPPWYEIGGEIFYIETELEAWFMSRRRVA
jgi:hypothetical protein